MFDISKYSREYLVRLRKIIEQAMANIEDDAVAIEATPLFPEWRAGVAYTIGYRVRHNGVLYKVLQPHTSQETWTPVDAPSLFAQVLIPDETVIPEWVQPDSTNPYTIGDKVVHNGVTYESLVDNNIWEPGVVGTESLWSVVAE